MLGFDGPINQGEPAPEGIETKRGVGAPSNNHNAAGPHHSHHASHHAKPAAHHAAKPASHHAAHHASHRAAKH